MGRRKRMLSGLLSSTRTALARTTITAMQQSRRALRTGGGRASSSSSVASKDVEGRWAALFCSPNDFWDNRATKRNPKAPDFKHKETGEALWIESRGTPAWVASSLKELDMNKQVDLNSLFGANEGGGGSLQQREQQRGSNE